MKILYYFAEGMSPLHAGLGAEVIENLKNEKHQIRVLNCDAVLANCYLNPKGHVIGCAICQARTQKLFNLVGIEKKNIVNLKKHEKANQLTIPNFSHLQELMTFNYKGINIGRGTASTIISLKRDYEINTEKYGGLIETELRKSVNVMCNIEHQITEFKPDKIYLFNGRFAEFYPVIELVKKYNIPYATVEAGSRAGKYNIYENSLPHSIKAWEREANKLWDNFETTERIKLANQWFNDKKYGRQKNDKSYIGKQTKQTLPQNFDESKINIAIFNSSEDEMKAIVEWQTELYDSQNEAIEKMVGYFVNNTNIHFYLRVHPNLGKVDNIQIREIEKMSFPNLTVIPPNSEVDTYYLMEKCDKAVSFGSTTGVEATYWGTPSILYGKSFYMNQDLAYVPKSFQELVKLIELKNLAPMPQENTFKYSLYVSNFGFVPERFEYKDKFNAFYKSEKIRRFYPSTIFNIFKYSHKIKQWFRLHKLIDNNKMGLKDLFRLK